MILIVGLVVGIWFVSRYAERVRHDPSRSLVYDMKQANEQHFAAETDDAGEVVLTGRHKVVLTLFGLAFVVMIYGVIPWEDLGIGLPTLWWWFPEMTASFLFFAILIGVVGRMKEGELTIDVRRRGPRPARRRPDHRHRPRHHRRDEQRPDHRHRPALGRERARRCRRGRRSPS